MLRQLKYISDWLEVYKRLTTITFINDQNQRIYDNSVYWKVSTITSENLIPVSIYFAVRKVIPATWLNDRDQF
ncbi:MAG: hypothetical protein U0T72_08570 [Chitinophagales bacterium]